MKTTVIGAGAWGTALAKVAHTNGGEVCLWGRDAGTLAALGQAGRNERYLPGIDLPRDLPTEVDLARAVDGAGCVVLAVPSGAFREVTARLAQFDGVAVSVTKGIEFESGLTMVGMLLALDPLMDDGTVIAEIIATHRAQGKAPLKAAVDAVREGLRELLRLSCALQPHTCNATGARPARQAAALAQQAPKVVLA